MSEAESTGTPAPSPRPEPFLSIVIPVYNEAATLEELVERYPSHALDIEIKGSGDAAMATADELARLIDEYDLTDHIVVVSFDVKDENGDPEMEM